MAGGNHYFTSKINFDLLSDAKTGDIIQLDYAKVDGRRHYYIYHAETKIAYNLDNILPEIFGLIDITHLYGGNYRFLYNMKPYQGQILHNARLDEKRIGWSVSHFTDSNGKEHLIEYPTKRGLNAVTIYQYTQRYPRNIITFIKRHHA